MNEESLFAAALEKPTAGARQAFLDEACGGDARLRQRLEQLLAADNQARGILDQGLNPTAALEASRPGPPLATGQVFADRFQLCHLLGAGGMGEVWAADQSEPVRRRVALKVIRPGLDSGRLLARFDAERQALALMDHPHIARVLDAGVAACGRPYFVMELIDGVPITRFCDEARLSPRQRLELFIPVCQAVQHAHQKGIIHRDLKPSNVLVARYDGQPVPKVIDFGVAKATGPRLSGHSAATEVGALVGTVEYMSPEQAEMSNLDIDTRSDIYSLGVLLYELLTGGLPFPRKQLQAVGFSEMLRIIKEVEPPPPSTRLSDTETLAGVAAVRQTEPKKLTALVKGELDWIVMMCLDKDRRRRYQTANALAGDVQRYLADEPVQAGPPSAMYRLRKFVRRNKGPLLAAGLMLLALIGGVIGAAYGLIEARKQREVTSLWQQAERDRDAAQLAQGEAEAARAGEQQAKWEVEEAREKLAAVEYGRTVQVAYQEWRENNVPVTLALLDGTRPDLRGWEWRYVHRLCHSEVRTLPGKSLVLSASFSPDGSRVAAGLKDNIAKVWDAKTGSELLTLKGHTGSVASVSFSADNTHVLTASGDRTARVWDAKTGAELLTLKGHTGTVMSASFSADGKRVLTGSADRTARVWDAKTGAALVTLTGHNAHVTSATFSPDGGTVLTGSHDRTARLWEVSTGRPHGPSFRHGSGVVAVSISPDGTQVLTGSADRTARVWDARTGATIQTLTGHTDQVTSVSFNADGSRVLTGSADRTAKVWDVRTGSEVLTLRGHAHQVTSAAFNRDGAWVVTGGRDATVKVWDARRETENVTLKGHIAPVRSTAFSPDGRRVVTGGGDRTAKVWDARTGALVLTLKVPTDVVYSASFSPGGSRLVTCSDRTAQVWDARSGAEILTLKGHTSLVVSASFSPDGTRVLTGSDDTTARVWDAKTGAGVLTLTHTRAVFSASFSPDGKQVVTGCGDTTARVWDAKTGAEVLTLKGRRGAVLSASFSPDGAWVVAGRGDTTAQVWDAKSGAEVLTLKGHTQEVRSALFSPDGARILTGSDDRTAKLWDAKTGAEVLTLKGHTDVVASASFSPDGAQVLTGSYDRTAKLWDAKPLP